MATDAPWLEAPDGTRGFPPRVAPPEVVVVTRGWPTDRSPGTGIFVKTEVEALRRLGLAVTLISHPTGRPIWAYMRLWLSLLTTLRSHPSAVVHAHYGFTGWVSRLQRRAPVVVTFHGSDLLGSRGMSGGRRSLRGRAEQWTNRLLARLVDRSIIVTPAMAALAPADAALIPAGVDTSLFHPGERTQTRSALGLAEEQRVILFVADPMRSVKRFALARAAVDQLTDMTFPVVLQPVHGRTAQEVAAWMRAADALLLTSESEGSPLVVREALASGLPVVSVDVGDVRHRLAGIANCHVTPPRASELAEALRRVLIERPRVAAPSDRVWTADDAARSLLMVYSELRVQGERR